MQHVLVTCSGRLVSKCLTWGMNRAKFSRGHNNLRLLFGLPPHYTPIKLTMASFTTGTAMEPGLLHFGLV